MGSKLSTVDKSFTLFDFGQTTSFLISLTDNIKSTYMFPRPQAYPS